MSLTQLTDDLDIIADLDDEPNDVGGLTADQLKAKFDEAAGRIKAYINDTLLVELAAALALQVITAAGYAEDAGSTDAYAITVSPAISAYTAGQLYVFKANTANTGASTLNVCSVGAAAIKKLTAAGLSDTETGDIPAGGLVAVVYDGTYFVALGLGIGSHAANTSNPHSVTAAQLGAADDLLSITSISASATLELAHKSKMLDCSSASTITLTVPPNSSVAFDVGTTIFVKRSGAGAVTVAAGSGVTITSKDSKLSINGQYAMAALIKEATDTWSLIGALV